MARIARDFYARKPSEQAWVRENTWCEECRLPDLGLDLPVEFEEDERVFVQGECRICGNLVKTELVDQRARDSKDR